VDFRPVDLLDISGCERQPAGILRTNIERKLLSAITDGHVGRKDVCAAIGARVSHTKIIAAGIRLKGVDSPALNDSLGAVTKS
jgi:hypothetical protein